MRFNKIFLVVFMILFFKCELVYADFGDLGGTGSSYSYNNSTKGNCSKYACWYTTYSTGREVYGYRITLVDATGKKVSGTHSVDVKSSGLSDFSNLNSYKATTNPKIYDDKAHTKTYERIYSDYEYRFSDRKDSEGKPYGANSSSDYVHVFLPSFPTNKNQLGDFITNDIIKMNEIKEFDHSDPNIYKYLPIWKGSNIGNEKVDFVSFILHYVGFLNSDEMFFDSNISKYYELSDKYLIFEPIFTAQSPRDRFGGSNMTYIYGTATEIAKEMSKGSHNSIVYLSDALIQGFWGNQQVRELACGSYDIGSPFISHPIKGDCWKSNYAPLSGITCYNDSNPNCSNQYSIRNLLNLDYGFGYRSVEMKFSGIEVNKGQFNMDLCESNDGVISFDSYAFTNKKEVISSDLFRVAGEGPTSIYCYDNVKYDFSDVIEKLRGDKKIFSLIDIGVGTANVKRTCYYDKNSTSYSAFDSIKEDYKDSSISLSYDSLYNFVPVEYSDEQERKYPGNMYTYSVTISYKLDRSSIILSGDTVGEKIGYIDFSNINKLFGRSNNLVEELIKNDGNYIYYPSTFSMNGIDGNIGNSENFKCSFEYNVDDVDNNSNFQFRIISLEDPFPARDGSIRLPGLNWLDKENKVFSYILNNRGIRYVTDSDTVSPEDMYSKVEPMYSITLTPSTMKKIREYNKNNNYNSMYTGGSGVDKLVCNSEGRECYSEFLRDSKYIPQESNSFSGVCLISNDVNVLRSQLSVDNIVYPNSEVIMNELNYGEILNDKSHDLNKNNRLDDQDYILSTEGYKGRNTQFYTCANKTFLSGGPIEGGS